jgi:hypothetical protein
MKNSKQRQPNNISHRKLREATRRNKKNQFLAKKSSSRHFLRFFGGLPFRLALNRSGKDDFKFFFGGKFLRLPNLN